MHFRKVFFLLLILFSFAGCSHKISEDKFILVYSDLVIAQDTLKGNLKQGEIKNLVFKRYNVSENEYTETLNYYNSNSRKWEAFFNKTISHLEDLRNKKGK